MKVLMISIDRGLLGQNQLGDVIQRHAEYGKHIDQLDVVVFSQDGFSKFPISSNVTAYPTNSKSKWRYFFDAKKLGTKLFQNNRYDLVTSQDPFVTGMVACRLKKKFKSKFLVHFHGDFWGNINWLKESKFNWSLWLVSRRVVSQADAIRVMSEGQKSKLGKHQVKAKIISTPVDLAKYQISTSRISSRKMVLHVGRYDKAKDFSTLAKAFKLVRDKISNADFVQCGAGPQVKEYFSSLPLVAYPKISQSALIDFYHQSLVVVLSSTSESFGKVLVEANACGKPVVATATTGAKEIVQDGYNGYLVPIGDAEKLAEKIIELLNDPVKAKELGENGRKLVQEKFGDNTNKIINFWREIVNG
ncbi:MAG: glycosyltransferase family 4 protein [Patescibacteria group bacterium]|jgi:glycosyltransferase involved in cell wall biosynthesis|nr:glycosyltransferase family 4 protein [Patescibacteria group bacterium]